MKLGEMLIRDGRLTDAQLATALAQQARDGGRLGTVMFELGFIDLEALTVYLGLELGIPIATGAMLERAKRSAVRLLSPQVAFKHKCVPLLVQDRQLIAAVEDPHDFTGLDAIADVTGYRIIPRVAPEARIYYYVERYYGLQRPARYQRFGDSPRGEQDPAELGLPPPPLPGLPPVNDNPVQAPGPAPRLRRPSGPLPPDTAEAVELEAEDLEVSLESDDAAPAEVQPLTDSAIIETAHIGDSSNLAAVGLAAAVPAAPDVAAPALTYPTLSASEAIAAIEGAADRGDIGDALIGFAQTIFDVSVLFITRDTIALGWKAAGDAPGRGFAEHILVPLEVSSVLQSALKSDEAWWTGPVTPTAVHGYVHRVLGVPDPAHGHVYVVRLGKRVVNLLYGMQRTRPSPGQADVGDLQRVGEAAAQAYARFIASAKKRTSRSSEAGS